MEKCVQGFLFLGLCLIFIKDTLGKSVQTQTDTAFDHPYSCQCEISINNSTEVRYDLGVIKLIDVHKDSTSLPCHALHHRCHKACEQAADLEKVVDKAMQTLGYHLCMKYEHMTPKGGASIYSHAKIHTAAACPATHDSLKPMHTSKKLCCGHSYVSLGDSKSVKAFGWNPDCHAMRYVF